jgi:error-prone DNA polymerase
VSPYVELHTASAFSFLQGASLPEALIERAATLGYPALALLDADGVYGAPRFHKAARQAGLRAIIGAEVTIGPSGPAKAGPHVGASAVTWRLPLLVASADGYRNLCRLITRMKMRAPKGEGALAIEELEGYTTGLVALTGRSLLDSRHHGIGGLLDRLVGLFGRDQIAVEIQRHLLRDEEADNTAFALPSPPTGRCSTCSRVSASAPRSIRRDAGCRETPSAI